MTDIEQILWGGVAGVTIYVIGQLLSKFLIEPLHELNKVVGNVRFNLAFYASVIHTPIVRNAENTKAARLALMDSACNLMAKLHAVRAYAIVRHIGKLPPNKTDIEEAAKLLRGLSTHVYEDDDTTGDNIDSVNKIVLKIEGLLRLKPLE